MGELSRKEVILAALTLAYILGAFALAGTMDYIDQQRYQSAWAESHGIP